MVLGWLVNKDVVISKCFLMTLFWYLRAFVFPCCINYHISTIHKSFKWFFILNSFSQYKIFSFSNLFSYRSLEIYHNRFFFLWISSWTKIKISFTFIFGLKSKLTALKCFTWSKRRNKYFFIRWYNICLEIFVTLPFSSNKFIFNRWTLLQRKVTCLS